MTPADTSPSPIPTEHRPRFTDERLSEILWHAELMEWGQGEGDWRYARDAADDSAYATWIELCQPSTIAALIVELRERRREAAEKVTL